MKRILVSIFLLVGVTVTSGTFAQSKPPTFQDDLLDRLVGQWNATGTVHGTPSKQFADPVQILAVPPTSAI